MSYFCERGTHFETHAAIFFLNFLQKKTLRGMTWARLGPSIVTFVMGATDNPANNLQFTSSSIHSKRKQPSIQTPLQTTFNSHLCQQPPIHSNFRRQCKYVIDRPCSERWAALQQLIKSMLSPASVS